MHCRNDNRWKLCLLDHSGQFNEICDCPKDARVVGNRKGGAWILKHTGASHQRRMFASLVSVSETGIVRDHGLALAPRFVACKKDRESKHSIHSIAVYILYNSCVTNS